MAKRKGPLRVKKKRGGVMRPGHEGKMELVQAEVDNPFRKGEREVVVKNLRESGLAAMHARGQIDGAQLRAGEWIRQKIEQSRMSSGVIDLGHEPVDTSGRGDPISDRVIAAAAAIAKIRSHVGTVAWPLVEAVCGDGQTLAEAANRRYGHATRTQRVFMGHLLRATLDEAAVYLGYAQHRGDGAATRPGHCR